ncbi:unnamed protein product [Rhizopus stolonifer]
MKALLLLGFLGLSYALINDINESCIVITPIGNTIVTAGEQMKIRWADAREKKFKTIRLIQSDGDSDQEPIVIAHDISTQLNTITVDLPYDLIPSNAYYMILGEPPDHCESGNLRIIGASAKSAAVVLSDIKNSKLVIHKGSKDEDSKITSVGSNLSVYTIVLVGTMALLISLNII